MSPEKGSGVLGSPEKGCKGVALNRVSGVLVGVPVLAHCLEVSDGPRGSRCWWLECGEGPWQLEGQLDVSGHHRGHCCRQPAVVLVLLWQLLLL